MASAQETVKGWKPPPGGTSGHADQMVRNLLPSNDLLPLFDYSAPHLTAIPDRLNAAAALIDRAVALGWGDRPSYFIDGKAWSFSALKDRVERLQRLLVEDWKLAPGGRVLLRGSNSPMLVACWLAVARAGGVAVTTMPLLRAKELGFALSRLDIKLALCEDALAEEMNLAAAKAGGVRFGLFSPGCLGTAEIDRAIEAKPAGIVPHNTAADDPVAICFTSGTTGNPKAAAHYHRDVVAIAECWPKDLGVRLGDIYCGSPSIAFAYGFAAFLAFPLRWGASVVMLPKATPDAILDAVQRHRATGLMAVPTSYNAMLEMAGKFDLSSLRFSTSAGEHLRERTFNAWKERTGLSMINGIGSTEFLSHFIAQPPSVDKPGATGRAVPGYTAVIQDKDGNELGAGERGWLAVVGPTGCRYFDDVQRQMGYVKNGWNVTGDIFERDPDGFFWFIDRGDDLIVSAGYNISGQEVERAILDHPKVQECAVTSAPDAERGAIVKAFIVLKDGRDESEDTAKEIQEFVKNAIAPYKYPRAVSFVPELPKTPTGKIQRFKLKEMA
jgi:2-aminobenzoate-CoA ligase